MNQDDTPSLESLQTEVVDALIESAEAIGGSERDQLLAMVHGLVVRLEICLRYQWVLNDRNVQTTGLVLVEACRGYYQTAKARTVKAKADTGHTDTVN
jgi:hypothetical protein